MIKMKRKINDFLFEWKSSPYRKPLIFRVGKTYSILEFGHKNYDNIAYFNFESNENLSRTFEGSLSPSFLIPVLSKISGQTITKGRTLIVFDEVQLCERALTSLKYFYEEAPEYHIIVVGSLLGIAVNRKNFSFPVGKVMFKTMYPMDFEEFMWTLNESELSKQIRFCFDHNEAMPYSLYEYAMKLYYQYLIVGGMPECVLHFSQTTNYTLVRAIQNAILQGYLNDMSKYNTVNEIKKTRLTYDSITVQLSKRNTRFQYKLLKKGARAAEFENAIEWLILSGIVSQVYRLDQVKKPLENYKDIDAFKIYISDTGLLVAKKGIDAEDILYAFDSLEDFKGGMTENYVQTQLVMNDYSTYYWESERVAEVDFIIKRKGELIPIEVKSSDNTKSKSLNRFIDQYQPSYAIRLSTKNFGYADLKKVVPLYAAYCI